MKRLLTPLCITTIHEKYPEIEFLEVRIEITSYGGLPEGLSEEDFFEGVSMPPQVTPQVTPQVEELVKVLDISLNINSIIEGGELPEEATHKDFLLVRQEGNHSVKGQDSKKL